MRISVVVPTRLQVNPTSIDGNLWLDRAVMSIHRQQMPSYEIVLALDKGMGDKVPGRFIDYMIVESSGTGQAAAVNTAVRASTGDVLAFLEDDDYWESGENGGPGKMAATMRYLDTHHFVSCNQREIDEEGKFVKYNAFATPSGWLMRRDLWFMLGGFDEGFRWHVDTDFLGRLNASGRKRIHLVHDMSDFALGHVARHSTIALTGTREPLVQRLRNPQGGMSTIARDEAARDQSLKEHMTMFDRYKEVPW